MPYMTEDEARKSDLGKRLDEHANRAGLGIDTRRLLREAASRIEALEKQVAEAQCAFQLETLRTSEQAALIDEQIDRLTTKGCCGEDWSKACADCEWLKKAKTLRETPINAHENELARLTANLDVAREALEAIAARRDWFSIEGRNREPAPEPNILVGYNLAAGTRADRAEEALSRLSTKPENS